MIIGSRRADGAVRGGRLRMFEAVRAFVRDPIRAAATLGGLLP